MAPRRGTYPDGGAEPFRGEKGSTWEGGFRVPALIRWPGVVQPGRVINDIFSHQDWLPTPDDSCRGARREAGSCSRVIGRVAKPTRCTWTATTRPRC